MMKMIRTAAAAIVAVTFMAVGSAQADRLEDIVSSGKLRCGVVSGAKPFGFLDDNSRELVGYDIDICKAVAAKMAVKPVLVEVSIAGRIPELQQGNYDVLAAALGYTAERAKQIDYSHTYYAGRQIVMVRDDSGIKDFAGLANKKVGTQKGSNTVQYLRNKIPAAEIVSYQDVPSNFLALQQNKVVAIAMTDTVAMQLREKAAIPLSILPQPLALEPWGLGIAKDQTALTQKVNAALEALEADGEAEKIYKKWFGESVERSFKIKPISQYMK